MPLFGHHGRYLRIDLSSRTAEAAPIPADVLRRFIGGTGLGTWILLEESAPDVDALAPHAAVVFVFSPLVGSPLTTSAKFAVVAKSPLTGRLNDSLASSGFAIAGKKTGYDALVVTGRADDPTILIIEPERVRFESAADVWGRSLSESQSLLRERLGSAFRCAVIGPAGENGVRFATVSHDGRHAGRGGTGAVLGGKNLKAIAVRGDRLTAFAHPERLIEYSRELSRKSFGPATAKYRELGTMGNLLAFNRLGTLPTRNFTAGSFEGALALAPETLAPAREKARESCAACTIGCEHIYALGTEDRGVRMEYENLFALGPLCGVSDPDVVLEASHRCDELGMDTISAGATIAFAMECAERGLIDAPTLRFGNGAALLETLDDIAARRGLGELLSLGTRAAAREIGRGAEDFAPHVKGLEIPGYEPRALQTMALGFAVNTRGADHNRSGAYQVDFSESVDRLAIDETAIPHAIRTENEAALMDSLILCKFLRGVFDDKLAAMAEMLELVTGWNVSADELDETAERIVTLRKWYNIRAGWTPAEDTLPRRFLSEPLAAGASAGATLDAARLRTMIRVYNNARGWSDEGWISPERLATLGIPPRSPRPVD
ncbi:MAG: aldehyde ferredoxin oxidoreductase family protein [Planctomycetaceae bacterium]